MNEILMALGGLAGLALLYYGAEYLVRGVPFYDRLALSS